MNVPALGLGLLISSFGALSAAQQPAEVLAVKGDLVLTMAGEPIENGLVLIEAGRIQSVGRADELEIPAGARVLQAAVVTPGLVDAHSVVGFSGYLNQDHDQDQLDRSEAIQPELRAIDAYNARERLVEYVREFGVTTLHTGHAPGQLVAGQTLIAKTFGESVEEAVLVDCAMVAATLGSVEARRGRDASDKDKSPGTRSKAVALLRAELIKAAEYGRKLEAAEADKRPDRNLRLEILLRVLKGEVPLLVTANRHHDILTALRIAREFELRLVLDGAAECYEVLDEIRLAGVPVILHPTMARAQGDRQNLSMATAATLRDAGIPFAIQSGFESYVPKTRVVLLEAAVAAANGLGREQALSAITIDAARILGIADRVGSLEAGKDADLALYDGDPFEYESHCVGVVIDGRVVSETVR